VAGVDPGLVRQREESLVQASLTAPGEKNTDSTHDAPGARVTPPQLLANPKKPVVASLVICVLDAPVFVIVTSRALKLWSATVP
jgi:hypothetical protein